MGDHEEFREEEVTKRLVREIKMDNVIKKTFDSSNKLKCPLREDNIIKIIDVEEEEEEERAERRRLSGRSRISLYEPPGRSSSLHKVLGKMRSDQDDGWKTVRRTASPEERVWLH